MDTPRHTSDWPSLGAQMDYKAQWLTWVPFDHYWHEGRILRCSAPPYSKDGRPPLLLPNRSRWREQARGRPEPRTGLLPPGTRPPRPPRAPRAPRPPRPPGPTGGVDPARPRRLLPLKGPHLPPVGALPPSSPNSPSHDPAGWDLLTPPLLPPFPPPPPGGTSPPRRGGAARTRSASLTSGEQASQGPGAGQGARARG